MGKCKEIILKAIPSSVAIPFVKKHHYSGKVVQNSQLHFGVFLDNSLHGVMSFGPSLDKSKLINIVKDTPWNGFVELNRMAFDSFLPKNSESRAISIAIKLIKKNCPHIKWVVSFADANQCGDGAIYRAAGFHLTGYSQSSLWKVPKNLFKINGGPIAHRLKIQDKHSLISKFILSQTNGRNIQIDECVKKFGGEILPGYMFRYLYILDKEYEKNINTKIYPYDVIKKLNAEMYKGEKIVRLSYNGITPEVHSGNGVQVDQAALLEE